MSDSILLSEKHGVNPAICKCFYCGGDVGVVLAGKLPGDVEAPHNVVWNMQPCNECEKHMKAGIILIEVEDDQHERIEAERQEHLRKYANILPKRRPPFIHNPSRAGGWWVIKEEAIKRMIQPPDLLANVLQCRWTFIEKRVAEALGLPRTNFGG